MVARLDASSASLLTALLWILHAKPRQFRNSSTIGTIRSLLAHGHTTQERLQYKEELDGAAGMTTR